MVEEVLKMHNCIPFLLEFHVFNTVHLVTVIVAVNINNNGQSHCCLGCTHSDREQCEEETFKLSREKNAVEDCKIQIYRVQYQFYRDKHGYKVTTCNEAKHSDKEQKCAKCYKIFYRDIHFLSSFRAIIIPPMIHAKRNTEMNSNGSTY